MARPRIKLTPLAEAEMLARAARGESGDTIAGALKGKVSARTLRRRKAELAGRTPAPSASRAARAPRAAAGAGETGGPTPPSPPAAAPAPSPPPDVPDDVPPGTPTEQLDRWIARLDAGAKKAELDGNLAALASIAAKVHQLMALRHRAAPIPKPDPNERPDYIALAKQFEDKFLQLVRGIFTQQQT